VGTFHAERRHGVVGRQLAQRAVAQSVTAAVSDVTDVQALLVGREAGGDERRAHARQRAVRDGHRVHALVGHLNCRSELARSTRHRLVALDLAVERRAHEGVLQRVDREAARYFPAAMPAHPVRHGEQRAFRHHQNRVFVARSHPTAVAVPGGVEQDARGRGRHFFGFGVFLVTEVDAGRVGLARRGCIDGHRTVDGKVAVVEHRDGSEHGDVLVVPVEPVRLFDGPAHPLFGGAIRRPVSGPQFDRGARLDRLLTAPDDRARRFQERNDGEHRGDTGPKGGNQRLYVHALRTLASSRCSARFVDKSLGDCGHATHVTRQRRRAAPRRGVITPPVPIPGVTFSCG
jgi:hypothetical protein